MSGGSDEATERRSDEGAGNHAGRRGLRIACNLLSAALLAGAGAYLIYGDNKGLGIFLVLIAAICSRVLVLNLAEGMR